MSVLKGGESRERDHANHSAPVPVSPAKMALVPDQPANEPVRFAGARYATRSVALSLDHALQRRLWQLVEQMPAQERDYLQVFELSAGFDMQRGILQRIVHRQEQPLHQEEHNFPSQRPVYGKLYAVDDGAGHGTLMWADEW